MRTLFRYSLLLLAGAATAACGDDDSGPTGPSRAEVAGVYSICQLTFIPAGTLASVNVLTSAFETSNTQVQQPELRVDPGSAIELVYTPRGAFVSQNVRGTYDLSGSRATLRFPENSRNTLLLPERLNVSFQASPRQLSVASSDAFSVPRAEYARLSGQPEANLADQIEGRLAATFRVGGCG